MAFSAMQDVIGAHWARPIRRIQEGFGAFVPVAIGLFFLFLIVVAADLGGAKSVYSWIKDPSILNHFHGKDSYLQPHWMYIRVGIILLLFLWVSSWQFKMSLKRDQLMIDGQDEAAHAFAKEAKVKVRFWSAPILIIYGVGFTFLCMDLIMSLSPLWFSTLWG